MKLLFLTEFYPRNDQLVFTGGVETRDYYVAERAKKDYKVTIIFSSSRQIPATAWSILSRLSYAFSSFWQAVTNDFDLIEASNVVTYLQAFLAAKIKNKPAVAWIPDVLGRRWLEFGWLVGIFGWLSEGISMRLPWTRIIALSQSTKAKLIQAGVEGKKITVVHGGIDQKEFRFKSPAKFKQFTVICVARLVKTKRLDQLIKAAAKLSVRLIIVGIGPEEKKLQRLSPGRVIFKKNLRRQELLKLISRCHLFCLPSVVEGFGIATIEAMACGLPAVLADISVNQEITKNGRGAVFFEPENIADLADKIRSIRRQYQQKKAEAITLAKSYSWDKVYQQTKAVYEACLYH